MDFDDARETTFITTLRGQAVEITFNRRIGFGLPYTWDGGSAPGEIDEDWAENVSVSYTEIEDDLIIDENDTKAIDKAIESYLNHNPPVVDFYDIY